MRLLRVVKIVNPAADGISANRSINAGGSGKIASALSASRRDSIGWKIQERPNVGPKLEWQTSLESDIRDRIPSFLATHRELKQCWTFRTSYSSPG